MLLEIKRKHIAAAERTRKLSALSRREDRSATCPIAQAMKDAGFHRPYVMSLIGAEGICGQLPTPAIEAAMRRFHHLGSKAKPCRVRIPFDRPKAANKRRPQ